MQYYYVSSPYGLRIHPKSKLNKCTMELTWYMARRGKSPETHISLVETDHSVNQLKSTQTWCNNTYGHSLHRLKVKKGDLQKEIL